MHDPPQDRTEGWHPDPDEVHQHRWWDGTAWTDFVADDGVARAEEPGAEHAARHEKSWRRHRTQDEWIDLGWKTSGCGCSSIPVVFTINVAIALMLFPVHGDSDPAPRASTIYTIFQVLMGLSMAVGFAGAIIGVITIVAILDRRRQRRRRRAVG